MIPVMIVEDEFLVRAGLKTSIQWEQEGFEIVAEAQNGEEALKLFEACRPAVIVTDIRLPGIDGIGMMKELRKRKAKVSFIVVSAYDDFQYAKEAIGIGVANYFLKGDLNTEEFLETLRELRRDCREQGQGEIRPAVPSIWDLYVHPNPMEAIAGEPEYGFSYLLYFETRDVNLEMLEAMIFDFFQHRDVKCRKLESEKGNWFLLYAKKEADAAEQELGRMFDRYVEEKITMVKSHNLPQCAGVKEEIYYTLLLHKYVWKYRGPARMPQKAVDMFGNPARMPQKTVDMSGNPEGGRNTFGNLKEAEERNRQEIRNLESELIEKLKFRKYQEAHGQMEQMKENLILSLSPAALFESIYRLIGVFGEHDEDLVAAKAYENLMGSLDLDYIFLTMDIFIDNLKEKKEGSSNYYVRKAREFVEGHYQEPIRVRDISEYIHVSPNYLGKIYFLNTGEHLRDYINSVKLQKAREFLAARKYQISEVAAMVGIDDQRYFSKLFKKRFGVSPKEFGKQTR